ncbi:MAG: hypothetical protein MUC86_08855 [Burkholderiaceae bacterium]|jgi:hypothetical protein|nr:hypothetical protein [Burkholderiaceae bacterium]
MPAFLVFAAGAAAVPANAIRNLGADFRSGFCGGIFELNFGAGFSEGFR